MKAITCAVIALVCVIGLVVADFGYGGYSYMPVYQGYGNRGGIGNGGILMFLGFIYLLMLLFMNFNQSSSPSVSIVNLTDDK